MTLCIFYPPPPREFGMFKSGPDIEQCNASINPKEIVVSSLKKHWKFLPVMSLAVLLTGCLNNDDSAPAASTLGGTAATGAPIVGGTVNVKCAGGSTLSDVTDNAGIWQVTMSGQTLPCAVEVSGGNLVGGQTYYSVALQPGTVNITPLTDLIVANLAGQAPGTWFSGLNANAFQQLTSNAVDVALGNLRTAFGLAALNDVNPLSASFTAAPGDSLDNVLEAMQSAFANNHAALLEAAVGANFATYAEQFRTALSEAYAALPTGGGSDGTLPAGISSKVFDLTYQNAQPGSPFSNGEVMKFTFSGSGILALGDSYRSIGTSTLTGSEYIWFDAANSRYFAVSLKPNGSLNEINVAGSANGTPWYGQFAGGAEQGGGTGGAGSLTIQASVAGVASPAITLSGVPAPSNQTEFCADMSDSNSSTSLGNALGAVGTFTITSCSFSGSVGNVSASLAITNPISMTVLYTVTYTYN